MKLDKATQQSEVVDATEIIEIAVDEINGLTRAFEMISQLCQELEGNVTPPAAIAPHLLN